LESYMHRGSIILMLGLYLKKYCENNENRI
jgi:hypothetical protein